MSIPLDPDHGGRSTTVAALRTGDILLSTTDGWGSAAIRAITGGGPASHAQIFLGPETGLGPAVVEAIVPDGVVLQDYDSEAAKDSLMVAFRYPGLSSGQVQSIVAFCNSHLGAGYNYFGAVADAVFRFLNQPVSVNLATDSQQRFFCSELILAAFATAGAPLSTTDLDPQAIVEITWLDQLEYQGHLKF